jgi:hypothetical protein
VEKPPVAILWFRSSSYVKFRVKLASGSEKVKKKQKSMTFPELYFVASCNKKLTVVSLAGCPGCPGYYKWQRGLEEIGGQYAQAKICQPLSTLLLPAASADVAQVTDDEAFGRQS